MSDESREREWLARSREMLDASVESIDPATRARLRAARATALAASARPRSRWLPVAGLVGAASAALVAIAVWRAGSLTKPGTPVAERSAPIATLPVDPIPLAAADDLDLLLDLDFFTWLAEDADAG